MFAIARISVVALVLYLAAAGCDSKPAEQHAGEEVHPLVGQKAPLFTSALLDGSPFDLAESLGQKVIVLDFWATWCGPCRTALPTLSEVAGEFRDRGVLLYAVDLDETPTEVKDFLTQSGLELTVIMDQGGQIANKYRVDAIPQTVIIDRQGTIQFVHVGVRADLREQLARELTQLTDTTAGKSTAESDLR